MQRGHRVKHNGIMGLGGFGGRWVRGLAKEQRTGLVCCVVMVHANTIFVSNVASMSQPG